MKKTDKYSDKINNLFKDKEFEWVAHPAAISSYVFFGPKPSEGSMGMLAGWDNLEHVARIGFNTEKGVKLLEIIAYPSMKHSIQEDILKRKGYFRQKIEDVKGFEIKDLFSLVKPLKSLEFLVEELKYLESVLLKKD